MRVVWRVLAALMTATTVAVAVGLGTGDVRVTPGEQWPDWAPWTPTRPAEERAREAHQAREANAELMLEALSDTVGQRSDASLKLGTVALRWWGGQLYAVVSPVLTASSQPVTLLDACDPAATNPDDKRLDGVPYLVVSGTVSTDFYAGDTIDARAEVWWLNTTAGDRASAEYVALPPSCRTTGQVTGPDQQPGTVSPAVTLSPGASTGGDPVVQWSFVFPADDLPVGSMSGPTRAVLGVVYPSQEGTVVVGGVG